MAEGYWITFYRSVSDPAALAAYAKLAGLPSLPMAAASSPAANAAKDYERGIAQRATVTEFDSVKQAVAAHDSPAYREALKALRRRLRARRPYCRRRGLSVIPLL